MGGEQGDRLPDRFWADYQAVLLSQAVPAKATAWYLKRARHFVWRRDLDALKALSVDDVEGYFGRVFSRWSLEEWQMSQVVDAVRLLCTEVLELAWAVGFAWDRWKQPHLHCPEVAAVRSDAAATSAAPERPPGRAFSDAARGHEADHRFPAQFERLRTELRTRHYSLRTEQTYATWLARFLGFRNYQAPDALGAPDVKAYLDYLATEREVSASTQNQALCALVFFYKHVLERPLAEIGDFAKAKRPRRLPEVLSRGEVRRLEEQLSGTYSLMAGLLYGAGLRLMECIRLRVKDLDFDQRQVLVRDGKGQKDRVTVLPETHRDPLRAHLGRVRALYEADLKAGVPGVYIGPALARKYPSAGKDWVWQWVFPSASLSKDPRSGVVRRHHAHETGLQRTVKVAARQAGITKRVTPHTLRHSYTRPFRGARPPGVPPGRAIPLS